MKNLKSFKLTIPHPCTESWEKMEKRNGGRYCSHCTKVVADFSEMSDAEIGEYIGKQKQMKGYSGICGRIQKSKLGSTFYYTENRPFQFNYALLRYSLAGVLTFSAAKSFSQATNTNKDKITQDNSGLRKDNEIKTGIKKTTGKTVFTIRVKDEESGKNLKSSHVEISGTGIAYKSKGSVHQITVADSLLGQTILITANAKGHSHETKEIILTATMNKTIFIRLDKKHRRRNREMVMGAWG